MGTKPRLLDVDASPHEREVLRLLGWREGTTVVSAPLERLLRETCSMARSLLMPKAVVVETRAFELFGTGALFQRADILTLGIVTIGSAIEEQADRYIQERELTAAMILDAFGSAAVEAAAVSATHKICSEFDRRGLAPGRRLSPGYPRWPITQQRLLFDQFEGATAGVLLNESHVMTPRKSISFGIPAGTAASMDAAGGGETGCKHCPMIQCEFRRAGYEVEEDS